MHEQNTWQVQGFSKSDDKFLDLFNNHLFYKTLESSNKCPSQVHRAQGDDMRFLFFLTNSSKPPNIKFSVK